MNRATFGKSLIALAGGLLVGDEALEALERLTHRKVFALGDGITTWNRGLVDLTGWTQYASVSLPPGYQYWSMTDVEYDLIAGTQKETRCERNEYINGVWRKTVEVFA